MDEYNDEVQPSVDTFQEDGVVGEFFVDIGAGLDNIDISDGFDEINDPNEISMLIKKRNGLSVDDELPIEEPALFNAEYFHDVTQEEYLDPDDF
jgi:hypothetical protein